MNACGWTYIFMRAAVSKAVEIYSLIVFAWRQCSQQTCRWWCLCCNRWLCWMGLIFATILNTILLVVLVLLVAAVVTVCWGTCILVFFFTLGGNQNRWNLNCFAADPEPPPPPSTPTVTITMPAASTPARYTSPNEPATFTAEGYDATGGRLPGSALSWFDTYRGVTEQPIGQGETITLTLVLRPADAHAGEVTEHSIAVVATGSDGRTARDSRTAFARAAIL